MTDEPRETKSEGLLNDKVVSRREFLKYAGLAGGTIAVAGGLGGLIAACGGTAATTTTIGAATTTTAGGTAATATTAGTSPESTEATSGTVASGEPIKLGFIEGFTGFMAYDAIVCEQGILTALDMLGNQVAGRPIEYVKADSTSDPVVAVDKARQLVEVDKINFVIGPVFSPAARAITDYLSRSSGIPEIAILGEPRENLSTANKLAFMPMGLLVTQGYYFGKYGSEQLGYKTVNVVNYEDTASHELQEGFDKGFAEGGGQVLSVKYIPVDTIDFSPYLTALKKADATLFWIFGTGAIPWVKQYHDYGLTAPLLVPMANCYYDDTFVQLGDVALGMVGADLYASTLDNQPNKDFVAAFQKRYPGEFPNAESFGAWQAAMMAAEAVKRTNGDTTPAKLIEAMSTMTIDGPAGKVTLSPYQDTYIPTRDFLMEKVQKVGDRITWVPTYTYSQVKLAQ